VVAHAPPAVIATVAARDLGPEPAGRPRVVVVGGGFAGAAFAIHLMRAAEGPVELVLIEPRGELGHGLAYGTDDPAHRINVPSCKMSVFAEEPGHFTHWLSATGERAADPEGESGDGWHFSRRQAFGRYVTATLRQALADAPAGTRLLHLRDRAVAIQPATADTPAQVYLEAGGAAPAARVVLAASHERPALPWRLDPETRTHPGLIRDPWTLGPLAELDPEASVAVLGTGLTMADVVTGLLARGHRGAIHAISRRGQLPRPHAAFEPKADFAAEGLPAGARAGLRQLRRLIAAEARAGRDWQTAVDGARARAEAAWQGWSVAEQATALRHLRAWWDVHRYRLAPQVDGRLRAARATGALTIHAGRIQAIARDGDRLTLRFRPRGETKTRALGADAIVNCMGPIADITRTPNPAVRSLLDTGAGTADAHRLGLQVDAGYRLIDAAGNADAHLRAVGPLTRGVFWEVVGVPELSAHCRRLAEITLWEFGLGTTARAASSA
jgi:uncharacterized NAD(P)/FAD-binding protein YdhS